MRFRLPTVICENRGNLSVALAAGCGARSSSRPNLLPASSNVCTSCEDGCGWEQNKLQGMGEGFGRRRRGAYAALRARIPGPREAIRQCGLAACIPCCINRPTIRTCFQSGAANFVSPPPPPPPPPKIHINFNLHHKSISLVDRRPIVPQHARPRSAGIHVLSPSTTTTSSTAYRPNTRRGTTSRHYTAAIKCIAQGVLLVPACE